MMMMKGQQGKMMMRKKGLDDDMKEGKQLHHQQVKRLHDLCARETW